MEMYIGITIEKIVAKIIITTGRTDNILAFGELHFIQVEGTEATFKIKGFVIKDKVFNNTHVICVDFPAYRAGKFFQKSFISENKELWSDINKLFLKAYYEQAGDGFIEKEINLDEIDKALSKSI